MHQLRLQAHVVPDQDQRRSNLFLHVYQGLRHDALHHHIERTCQLIGNDQPRVQGNGHGNARALLHASAQLMRVHIGDPMRQAECTQQRLDALTDLVTRLAALVDDDHVFNLLAHAHHRVERVHRSLRDE